MISPEQKLWSAVVRNALLDAMTGRTAGKSIGASAISKREAHAWIMSGGKDFQKVCTFAGLDPVAVRDRYVSGRIDLDGLYGGKP